MNPWRVVVRNILNMSNKVAQLPLELGSGWANLLDVTGLHLSLVIWEEFKLVAHAL